MGESSIYALLGGLVIGLSSSIMLLTKGKILGVSGIVGGLFNSKSSNFIWRAMFLLGLIAGGFIIEPLGFTVMKFSIDRPLAAIGVGGLLVGFGTTLGNGCTSGHGVCGVSRFSKRSIIATILFITTGILTVTLINYLFKGGL